MSGQQNINSAKTTSYNNTSSGLSSTDVQGAIDELSGSMDKKLQSDYTESDQVAAWWVSSGNLDTNHHSITIPEYAIYVQIYVSITDSMQEYYFLPADLVRNVSGVHVIASTFTYGDLWSSQINLRFSQTSVRIISQSYGNNVTSKEKSIAIKYLY